LGAGADSDGRGREVSDEVIVTSEFVRKAKHLYRMALRFEKARRDYTNRPIKKYLDKVAKSEECLCEALTRFNYGADPLAEGGGK